MYTMEMHRCTSQKWRRMQTLGNYRRREKDMVNSRRMVMEMTGGARGRCLGITRVTRVDIRNSTLGLDSSGRGWCRQGTATKVDGSMA